VLRCYPVAWEVSSPAPALPGDLLGQQPAGDALGTVSGPPLLLGPPHSEEKLARKSWKYFCWECSWVCSFLMSDWNFSICVSWSSNFCKYRLVAAAVVGISLRLARSRPWSVTMTLSCRCCSLISRWVFSSSHRSVCACFSPALSLSLATGS